MAIFIVGEFFFNKLAAMDGVATLTIYGLLGQLIAFSAIAARSISASYVVVMGRALASKSSHQYYPIFWASAIMVGFIYIPVIYIYI